MNLFLQIIGIILVIVLLIIIIAFLIPITVTLKYKDIFSFKMRIAGIGYDPLKGKKNEDTDENKKTKVIKAKPTLKNIKEFANTAKDIIKQLPFRIKVKKLYLKMVVVSDDAAKTAIEYGGICSVVYSMIGFMQNYVDLAKPDINITAGFEEKKGTTEFESIISTWSGNIILAYLKHKIHAK